MIRRIALGTVGRTPVGLRSWVYRHPRIWHPLARVIGRLVPHDQITILDIRVGPNAGMKLAANRATPRYYWLDGNYEADVVRQLREWVRPGMVVADVGAHVGFMAMYLAKQVGPGGAVLSFEPSPAAMAQLRQNVEINRLTQVTPMQIALSDAAGQARFIVRPYSTTSGLARGGDSDGNSIEVRMERLDDVVFAAGGTQRLDVVKIDVEGSEAAVLRGAARVLAELRPNLLIEVHNAAALADCLSQLRAARYEVIALHPDPYYEVVLRDPAAAQGGDAAAFAINHLRCLPR
ncbi:MAG TPA: FkbM family methyltransferase [Tepidisphaeraceae bacterium]|nr:FkbM family methyltransferase [Tepidisphaeraceae bacterium]